MTWNVYNCIFVYISVCVFSFLQFTFEWQKLLDLGKLVIVIQALRIEQSAGWLHVLS